MEATSLLTATNQDIQKYIEKGNTNVKKSIINNLKDASYSARKSFYKLFPLNTKRYKVMDEIVFMLSVGGICKVSADTLSKNTDTSIRTVKSAVKALKETRQIIVAGLSDGKNKYVFVNKYHADYQEILRNVFYIDKLEENEEIAPHIAQQVALQVNAGTVVTQGIEGGFSTPNSNNLINFKQEKDIIRDSIESEAKQSERIEEYCTNPYQKMLYDYINDNDYHAGIKENASVIALRAGSNCNEQMFKKACVAVNKVDKFLYFGGLVESVPALFDKIYSDRIVYMDYYKPAPIKQKRDTSYLYNWLES